jgi:phenylacetate-CoA ligase
LEQSHHPSRSQIAAGQLTALKSLLAELIPANEFYASKLNSLGVTFDVASVDDFSKRFPFTTKNEIVQDQRAHPPYGTNLTYPLNHYTRYHQTSGTASTPVRWLDTPESWEAMVESWMEILRVAAVQPADRLYFAFSFGPFIGFWLAFEAGARLGCLCVPGGGLSSAARLRAIVDNRISVLCCTPTYAMRLAEVAAAEKIDLSQSPVRLLVVAGEPGGSIPSVRARLSELWHGARVFDHHGMTEVGPVTYECPVRPGVLHVLESAYLAEVVAPDGSALQPGQPGELVLTTLERTGSPLLRYRTGDVVKSAASGVACACGRYELALEGGILARTDDMVVVRGVNVFPSAVEQIVRGCDGVAEYRVDVSTNGPLTELSLQVEANPDYADAAGLVKTLERQFETAFSLRVPVTLVPYQTLPRAEMKSKRWQRRGSLQTQQS